MSAAQIPCCCHIEAAPERTDPPAVLAPVSFVLAVVPAAASIWTPPASETLARVFVFRATASRGPPPGPSSPRAPPAFS